MICIKLVIIQGKDYETDKEKHLWLHLEDISFVKIFQHEKIVPLKSH